MIFLQLIITLAVLFFSYEFFRRSNIATYLVFIPGLLILSFFWIGKPEVSLFKWVKVYSASAGVILFTLIRNTKLKDKKYIMYFVYGILAVNIAEAVIKDFAIFEISSIINAITGIILIATMRGIRNIKVQDGNLIWSDLDWGWIFVYTVWNILVVMGADAPVAGRYTILLIAPILAETLRRGTWLQARATSLAVMLMVGLTIPEKLSGMNMIFLENTTLKLVVGVIGFVSGVFYLIYLLKKKALFKSQNEIIVQ